MSAGATTVEQQPSPVSVPKRSRKRKVAKMIDIDKDGAALPPATNAETPVEAPVKREKKKRAPSAYGAHMRTWMAGYKTSGFAGSTKEYFALGARGWRDRKTPVEEKKKKSPVALSL